MNNICKICNQIVSENSHFYKIHKITQKSYYEKYFPRFDKFNGLQIEFKSEDSYFNKDFQDKNNLKKYLESISKEEGLNYLKEWLLKRKNNKGYIYSPSNLELRTLCYPSIKYFHNFYGKNSYENLCKEIGLINRYDYNQKLEYKNDESKILIDTRESRPLSFDCSKEIIKLNYGDYCAKDNPFNVYIERKSIQDFIGSICSGFNRLCKEMQRAKDNNAHIIILIESKISNLFGFNRLGYLHSQATVEYVNKRIRDLLLKYDNVQICCVDGRKEASDFIINLYKLKNDPKTIDFQYIIDMGIN